MSGEFREWLQFALWVAVGLYTWLANKERASRAQVDQLRRDLDGVEARMAVVTERVNHLPSSDEFATINTQLQVIAARLEAHGEKDVLARVAFEQQLALVRAQYDRIDTFLRGKFQ